MFLSVLFSLGLGRKLKDQQTATETLLVEVDDDVQGVF